MISNAPPEACATWTSDFCIWSIPTSSPPALQAKHWRWRPWQSGSTVTATLLYLSAITIAEIEPGIAKARRIGSQAKADRLAEWLETVIHLHSARILPLDLQVARTLGNLSDLARSTGATPDFADLAIAATAISRGYTLLTRNLRHFRDMPVACLDPFVTLPKPG